MGLFGKKKQVKATPKVQEWRFKLSNNTDGFQTATLSTYGYAPIQKEIKMLNTKYKDLMFGGKELLVRKEKVGGYNMLRFYIDNWNIGSRFLHEGETDVVYEALKKDNIQDVAIKIIKDFGNKRKEDNCYRTYIYIK